MLNKGIWFLIPTLEAGGAERVFVNLANHLARKGFPISLVVLRAKGPMLSDVAREVKVIDLETSRVRYAAGKLIGALSREKPAAVLTTLDHLNMLVGLLRPFFPRTRFYCRETAIPSLQFQNERWPALFAFLCRWVYPRFDAVVCQSTGIMEDLKTHFLGARARLRLIHNPVDVEWVRKMAGEGNPFAGQERVILVVGRFARQKQFHLLPGLLKRVLGLTRAHMHILGDGPLRPDVAKAFVSEGLSEHVRFWGIQKNPYKFMRYARLLVLVSAYEGFPNVLVEANAVGIPVVAFRCPGVGEEVLVDGCNGYLVAPNDLDGMAGRVADILDGRETFPRAAEWVAGRFGIETISGKYAELLTGPEG